MSSGIIYQVDGDGKLVRMLPSKPANEAEIQALIASHPEMVTGSDEPLLLIEREVPIADRVDGSGRWSLDHLFVTRHGKPVLVEVKQASNTQLRREVIGQILEYAANASSYWGRGKMAETFNGRFPGDPEQAVQELEGFLSAGFSGSDPLDGIDPSGFWDRVEANLLAGVLKLVIVADEIPRELSRIVEFLNEQMQAEVQAVELRWFSAEGGITALVPRIIGATERAAERKPDSQSLPPHEYWVQLKERYPALLTGKPWKQTSQNLITLRSGDPTIVIGAKFVKGELRIYIYFDYDRGKDAYNAAKILSNELTKSYPWPLQWDDMGTAKAARIVDVLPNAHQDNRQDWQRQHDWLAERGFAMRTAMEPLLGRIEIDLAGVPATIE